VVSDRHGPRALPGEYPVNGRVFAPVGTAEDGTRHGVTPRAPGSPRSARFPLAPFFGVTGVAAAGNERPRSVPPRAFGGGLDIRRLREGARAHLPVQVPGELADVGDAHFARGVGELAMTAMEASPRATLRFQVMLHRLHGPAMLAGISGLGLRPFRDLAERTS
jgi:acetamidase/formamidase